MYFLWIYLLGVIVDFTLILCLRYHQVKNSNLDMLEKRITFKREMMSDTPLCVFSWLGLIIAVGTALSAWLAELAEPLISNILNRMFPDER
uniref:Uncharacterized protein n=1 Tax=Podoviridae sp. ctz6O13 TaxID=2827757 RepID=A0A8S5TKH4_9CAUD|nr:MAG TPA: hypothetical protein [Podoviridae sp. ctz6O13]